MKSKFLLILHKSCLSTQFAKFSVQKTREVRQIDENFLHFLVNFSLLPTDVIFEKNQLFFALLSSTQCENSRILLPLLPFNIFPHNIHWAHLIPEKLQVVIKSQGQKNYLIFTLWKRNHFGDNTFSSHSKPFSFSKNSRNTPRLQD